MPAIFKTQLSKIPPTFVDKLTPQGRVPTDDEITRCLILRP